MVLELTLVHKFRQSSRLGLLTSGLVFHCFVASWRSHSCRFSNTKTLPTPCLPCFFFHGQVTQMYPAVVIKTATF